MTRLLVLGGETVAHEVFALADLDDSPAQARSSTEGCSDEVDLRDEILIARDDDHDDEQLQQREATRCLQRAHQAAPVGAVLGHAHAP